MLTTNEHDDLMIVPWDPKPGKSLLADLLEASAQYNRFSLAFLTIVAMLLGARTAKFLRGRM